MELEDVEAEYRELDTQIPVSKETRKHLRSLGMKGDTYDKIIQKLMKKAEE